MIPLPYKSLAVALIAAVLFGVGWWKGSAHKQAQFDAYKAQVEALAAIQKAKNEETLKRQEKAAKDAQNTLEKRLGYLHDAYRGLREARSGGMPRLSDAAPSISACPQPDLARLLERMEAGVLGVLEKGDGELIKYQTLWEWAQRAR